jgi:hypothetical protein
LHCVTLSAVVGTSVDIQSVDTSYHTQDLSHVAEHSNLLNMTLCFRLFCCSHCFGGADTNPGAQHVILEALKLTVALVVIPGRQEAEF